MPAKQLKPRLNIDSKGRIVIPKIVRDELKLTENAIFELEIYGDKILLTILRR